MAEFPFRIKDYSLRNEAEALGIQLWRIIECGGPDELRREMAELRRAKASDYENDRAQELARESRWEDDRHADPYPFKRGD